MAWDGRRVEKGSLRRLGEANEMEGSWHARLGKERGTAPASVADRAARGAPGMLEHGEDVAKVMGQLGDGGVRAALKAGSR